LEDPTRVLLILSQDVLARARVLAGKATATVKLPVSLQIVLRALIEEGLKAKNRPSLLSTIEAHALTIHETRRRARRRSDIELTKRTPAPSRPGSRAGQGPPSR
jgi:hypothetical protein